MGPAEQVYTDPFRAPGRWYRGNLHTHTRGSDGLLTAAEAVGWYREQGYDFVALTDHHWHANPTDTGF